MEDPSARDGDEQTPASEARTTAAWLNACPAARAAFEIARDYCAVPALVVGLMESDHVYLALRHGIEQDALTGPSPITAHLFETGETLLVTDARRDPRFVHHVFVQNPPYARFIAAAPVFGRDKKPIGGVVAFDAVDRPDAANVRRRVERVAHLMTEVLAYAQAPEGAGRGPGTPPHDQETVLVALETEEARRVVARLGRRWGLQILLAIARRRSARFNRISQDLPGVNSRTLSDRLRELEEDGFISRRQFNEVPVRVEYSLTPAGERLLGSLASLVHAASRRE